MGDDDQTKQINNLEKSIDPTVLVQKPKPVNSEKPQEKPINPPPKPSEGNTDKKK